MYQKYIDELRKMNQNYDTRAMISILEKQQKDDNTRLHTAIREAESRGETRGKAEEKIEVAKKAKENNFSIDSIILITGLTKEEIEKL